MQMLGRRRVGGGSVVLMGALAVGAGGCGDDGPATPADTGSSDDGESEGTSGTGPDPTTMGSTGDGSSTGATGADTTAGTTMGPGSSSGSSGDSTTGEPDLPPQTADDLYFVREDGLPLVVDVAQSVLSNDVDPEGSALVVDSFDAMSVGGGTVVMAPDGSFEYAAAPGFVGDDSFTYVAIDDAGSTASATVRVSVAPLSIDLGDVGTGGLVIDGESTDDESGTWVAGGGDVNGDGLDDLLVSSPLVAAGAGRTWVVFGRVGGGSIQLSDVSAGVGGFVIEGEAAGDAAGTSAAIVGDVNGDGLADVLVGAPAAGPAGRAYLVHGKADGAAVALADVAMGVGGFVLEGDGTSEDAGTAVAGAGDIDGDGRSDLLVGAPEGGPIPAAGRSYVIFGKADTAAVALGDVYLGVGGFVIRGAGFDDESGTTLAGAGDVDGDGLDDVLVGAQLANPGGFGNAGRCYVVFGRTSTSPIDLGSLGSGGFFIDGREALDEACSAIAGLGDMNGDGRADVAVGAPADEDDVILQGRSYVVFGKADAAAVLLDDVAMGMGGFVIDGEAAGDFLGLAVGGPGDMDGDGYGDLVISARRANPPSGVDAGRSYVIFGGNFSGALTHLGDDADDVLVGGPGIDVIVAGAGDDLIGIRSGQLFRLRGGSGYDTLVFEDGGVQLDLGVITDAAIRDVEAIDITGTGDNVLSLGLRDLRAMVGPSHTLRVIGDASDTLEVDLSGSGFIDEGVAAGVHTWSNGVLTLEVEEPLVGMVVL